MTNRSAGTARLTRGCANGCLTQWIHLRLEDEMRFLKLAKTRVDARTLSNTATQTHRSPFMDLMALLRGAVCRPCCLRLFRAIMKPNDMQYGERVRGTVK